MLGLLSLLMIKSLLLIMTLAVFWLALRRLLLSKSANAWLYAATAFFSLLTTLGLAPWAVGFGQSHPIFFVFAAMGPAIWYGVVTMCNSTRPIRYDSELERTFLRFAALARAPSSPAPLVLQDPVWPEAPQAVFRHTTATRDDPIAPETEQAEPSAQPAATRRSRISEATQTLIGVARGMRRNETSEGRRIKLLPPPARPKIEAIRS